MRFLYKQENIDYDFFKATNCNTTTQNILFLHGWGGNKFSFASTINLLKCNYNILTITLPTITPTKEVWDYEDYINLITALLKLHNINSVIIVAHSFGFRLSCMLSHLIKVDKIIVSGGAGLKKFKLFKKIGLNNNKILLKQRRFNYLYKKIASADYLSLSATNKKTFNNIVMVNTKNLIKFNCPMLLFWGKRDKETPISFARKIQKTNKCKLIVTNSNHFAYLEENALFNNALIGFLK